MNLMLLALGAGASAGAIILFLSHVAAFLGAGNFVRDIDQPLYRGRDVTRREAHYLGILVHLVISTVAGGLFAVLEGFGLTGGFDFFSILVWSLIIVLVVGGIVLPLEGHGVFGMKEDAWFPIDLILAYIIWGVIFWWIMNLWLGYAKF